MPTMQRNPAGGVIDPRMFGRGAGTVKPAMPVPGFANGGYLNDDDEDIEGQGYDDAMVDPMSFVSGALNYGRKKYGIPTDDGGEEQEMGFDDGGVVPTMTEGEAPNVTGGGNPNATDPRQAMAYLSGDGAVSQEIAQALEQRVDPQGQLDPTQRAMAAISVAPSDEARFGLLQHYRTKYNAYTGAAKAALAKGDMGAAAQYASMAMDAVPDGKRTQFAPAQGGLAMISKPSFGGGQPQQPQQQSFADGGEVEDDEAQDYSVTQPARAPDPVVAAPPQEEAAEPPVPDYAPEPVTDPQATMPQQSGDAVSPEVTTAYKPEVVPANSIMQMLSKGFDDQIKGAWRGFSPPAPAGASEGPEAPSPFDSRRWLQALTGAPEPPAPTTGSEAATRTPESAGVVPAAAAPAAAPAATPTPPRRAMGRVAGSLQEPTRPSSQGVIQTNGAGPRPQIRYGSAEASMPAPAAPARAPAGGSEPPPPMRMGRTDLSSGRKSLVNPPTYHPSGFDPNGVPAYGSQRVRGFGPGLREQTGDPAFMDPNFRHQGSQPVYPTNTGRRTISGEEAVAARAAAPDVGAPAGDRYGPGVPTQPLDRRLGGGRGGMPVAGTASGMGSGGRGVIPTSGGNSEEDQYNRAMQRIEDEAARRFPAASQQGDRQDFVERRTAEYGKQQLEFGKENIRGDKARDVARTQADRAGANAIAQTERAFELQRQKEQARERSDNRKFANEREKEVYKARSKAILQADNNQGRAFREFAKTRPELIGNPFEMKRLLGAHAQSMGPKEIEALSQSMFDMIGAGSAPAAPTGASNSVEQAAKRNLQPGGKVNLTGDDGLVYEYTIGNNGKLRRDPDVPGRAP